MSVQTPSVRLARLPGPHGYRFDGDTVHLNAMFALLDPAAHERSWALQLWACPCAPVSAQDLVGRIVAEVALPPIGELADEIEHFEVSAFARPPAGGGEHVMVLVLAAGRPGQFNDVHDFAIFLHRQQFVQPRMNGNVGYRIDGARVQISVDRVENPRVGTNRSGTLSLELWALPASFAGGNFLGHHLAGVEIGSISGQNEMALQAIDLAFTQPPAGTWQIVLMLREWTAAGFVTRDFTNFATPFVSAQAIDKPSVAVVPAKSIAPVAAKTPVTVAANIPPAVGDRTPAPVIAPAPAKASAAEATKAVAPALPARKSGDATSKCIAVNTAGVEELAAVKGLSRKLAKGIVEKRPFASLDDLLHVKGLGAKTLAKIRSSLKL
ncbi:MAG TPA: helix-hairpin-helix domain-containing protein [Verrucomicrobiae bacterium]|nr:helix-hairpin-helix domain-containing protein [Verrucomicrobiae bacterium]